MKGWTTREPENRGGMTRIVGYLLLIGVPVATLAFAIKTVADALNPGARAEAAWANAAAAQANAAAAQALAASATAGAVSLAVVAVVAALAIGSLSLLGVVFTAWQRLDDARREHQLAVLRMQQQALAAGEPRREIVIIGEHER